MSAATARVWLFDLDNTLHDAGAAAFAGIDAGMTAYIERELGLPRDAAGALRAHYLHRYGATLLGLVRHHGVRAAHFLHETHRLPGLEERVTGHAHDFDALKRLRGRKLVVTNAPEAYAQRVLRALGLMRHFDSLVSIEQMSMFGDLRPKPDARMLRWLAARLKVHPARCVLVEDTLVHQKSARRVGMATVWMQRFARRSARSSAKHVAQSAKVGVYLHRKPAYVYARIFSLQALLRTRLPR